jgi:hypothetical protein
LVGCSETAQESKAPQVHELFLGGEYLLHFFLGTPAGLFPSLNGRLVLVLCNIKERKLTGFQSQ